MSKLLSILGKEPFSLIVELQNNDLALAKAAEAEGADAVMLTIDDGQRDKKDLLSILKQLKVPVGAKLKGKYGPAELNNLIMLGADYVDFNIEIADSIDLKHDHAARIGALSPDFNIDGLTRLSDKPLEGLDAAIVPDKLYGKELTVGDLQQFITICLSTGLPVIVPTQKWVRTSEIPLLWDTGAKAVILTKTVTGDTERSLRAAVKEYREAVDSIKEQ